ncbi:MAG: glycerophosphodiester phosphodiesterase [Mycobacterium sp.]|jgi:glycerophosphoryl diester phosphodiesterase|nr:glycerophosphodiester phosphodiesterase [Mycobacterium sp.]
MVVIVGHRGAPSTEVENTVEAVRAAQAQGADAVEIDVRLSSDGVPVLLHDRTFHRIWDRDERPEDLTHEQISRLRPDGGDAHVPTLAEVAGAVDLELIVDLKNGDGVHHVMDQLKAAGAANRARFIGEPEVLTQVRRALPDAEIVLSHDLERDPTDLVTAIRPIALNLPWDRVDSTTAAQVRDYGCSLWTYCVDTPADLERAMSLGATGIISNNIPALGLPRREVA